MELSKNVVQTRVPGSSSQTSQKADLVTQNSNIRSEETIEMADIGSNATNSQESTFALDNLGSKLDAECANSRSSIQSLKNLKQEVSNHSKNSSFEIDDHFELDEADKSEAFLNDLFSSTEKRVEYRNSSRKKSASKLNRVNNSDLDSEPSVHITSDNHEQSNSRVSEQSSSAELLYSDSQKLVHEFSSSKMTLLATNVNSDNDSINRKDLVKFSPGQRHSAEIYSPQSQVDKNETKCSTGSGKTKENCDFNLTIDTKSLLDKLNKFETTLSPIISQYQ